MVLHPSASMVSCQALSSPLDDSHVVNSQACPWEKQNRTATLHPLRAGLTATGQRKWGCRQSIGLYQVSVTPQTKSVASPRGGAHSSCCRDVPNRTHNNTRRSLGSEAATGRGRVGPRPGRLLRGHADGIFRPGRRTDLRGHGHLRGYLLILTDARPARTSTKTAPSHTSTMAAIATKIHSIMLLSTPTAKRPKRMSDCSSFARLLLRETVWTSTTTAM